MVKRRLTASLAVLLLITAAYPASAEGFGGEAGYSRPHRHGHHGHFGRHHRPEPIYGGGYGVPVVIPGVGTYAGTVSALRIRGHGTYYYAEGLGAGDCGDETDVQLAPRAKIVDATKGPACSYENGVCVIRP